MKKEIIIRLFFSLLKKLSWFIPKYYGKDREPVKMFVNSVVRLTPGEKLRRFIYQNKFVRNNEKTYCKWYRLPVFQPLQKLFLNTHALPLLPRSRHLIQQSGTRTPASPRDNLLFQAAGAREDFQNSLLKNN